NPSWNTFLWRESPEELRLLLGSGITLRFTKVGTKWESPDGFYGMLSERAGSFTVSLPQGVVLSYLPLGDKDTGVWKLVAQEDRFGNLMKQVYPGHGRLAFIADPL